MFKIEVDVNGQTYGHYFMNKHADDFAQFLPKMFMATYGEVIAKEAITIYKIDEASQPLLEGKLRQSVHNSLDRSVSGQLVINRNIKAEFNNGDYLKLEDFYQAKGSRENAFSNSKNPQTVKKPTTIQHDFEDGEGLVDAVKLTATNELVKDYSSEELVLTGTALARWPYDAKGNFLGNK